MVIECFKKSGAKVIYHRYDKHGRMMPEGLKSKTKKETKVSLWVPIIYAEVPYITSEGEVLPASPKILRRKILGRTK